MTESELAAKLTSGEAQIQYTSVRSDPCSPPGVLTWTVTIKAKLPKTRGQQVADGMIVPSECATVMRRQIADVIDAEIARERNRCAGIVENLTPYMPEDVVRAIRKENP